MAAVSVLATAFRGSTPGAAQAFQVRDYLWFFGYLACIFTALLFQIKKLW
jgi:hypothetical protein